MFYTKSKNLFVAAIFLIIFVAIGLTYMIAVLEMLPIYLLGLPLLLILATFFLWLQKSPDLNFEKKWSTADGISRESGQLGLNPLLSNISHEVKTPMIGILGSVDLLEQSPLEKDQLEHLYTIRTCSEDLLAVFNDILDMSRLELGQVQVNLGPFQPKASLTGILEEVGPSLEAKGLKLQLRLGENLPQLIVFDQGKLERILKNVINKMVLHTSTGPIVVKTEQRYKQDEKHLLLTIENTASDIIFQEFLRVLPPDTVLDASQALGHGGAALSYYVCQQLLSLMGGSIVVENPTGSKAIVYIDIPLHEAPASDADLENTPAVLKLRSALDYTVCFDPAHILLAEDNLLNQRIICQMLSNYGFSYRMVNNGIECLAALGQESFDVVLLDMQMPLMDGYETIRAIRQDNHLRGLAVIAMTAHSMVGDKEKCLHSGCTDYISKPFNPQELIDIITSYLPANRPEKPPQMDAILINELMPDLLETLAEMVHSLQIASNKKDLKQLQDLVHDVKGTAGMYGLTSISATASQLERAIREFDYENISVYIHLLQKQHQETQTVFGKKDMALL